MKRQDIGKQSVLKGSKWLRGMGLVMLMLCAWNGAMGQTPDTITDVAGLNAMTATGNYVIGDDIDASGFNSSISSFSGTMEANINPATNMPYRIKNLSVPLFTTLTGTVKNLVLEDVSITTSGNAGAIAVSMQGTSSDIACIYNCGILSGSVGGTGHVGGLVGDLGVFGNNNNCYARVINCFSYADITSGSEKAGIVGHNYYGSKSGTNTIRTMVMNCMFYGDIATGNSVYPIYGGTKINNNNSNKLNNYNYFRYEAPFSENNHTGNVIITDYNCALAAETRYLEHFEFYRLLLNSTKCIAAWYATGSTADASGKMLKWVLDRSIAPYPILKAQGTYPSIINPDFENAVVGMPRSQGGKLGTLAVTISGVGDNAPTDAGIDHDSLTLVRTDKDTINFNFNYDKVQLPYFHEVGHGNYTGNKAVTGWKITGMTGGTQGTFDPTDHWGGYNFADRNTYAKDLYSQNGGLIFSQGAYFDVPKGVTGITIVPYWGNAQYLSDKYYDRYGYSAGDVEDFGQRYTDGGTYTINGSSQKVYTSFSTALSNLPNGTNVYDNVVVLVGNYHKGGDDELSNGEKAFTITSIDLDEDNEPDYSLIFRSGKQKQVSPIRYDFINVVGMAMAHKTESDSNMGIPGNCKPRGWFEVTNTALIHFTQFEYDSELKYGSNPLILLGGVYEQIVSTNGNEGTVTHTKYIHVGSNAWFKLFNNGCHMDKSNTKTPHFPISVTGGQYEKFYLSGYFRPDAPVHDDDAECYIDGGSFGEVAGAGQEEIKGNVTWDINHADMKSFFGGGINDAKAIKGDIIITIKNSYVEMYCSGPKFGNMSSGKKAETTATDCIFGTFFGAGYGGNSFYRYIWNSNSGHNQYGQVNYDWNGTTWLNNPTNGYKRGKYVSGRGILVQYDYEHFEGSNTNTVARLYMLYASLSVAQTNGTNSMLKRCTVNKDFYGGGNLGYVLGDAVSTLDSCVVHGNVFGGGYSADVPTIKVFDQAGFDVPPYYNTNTGVFEKGVYPASVSYKWSSKGSNSDSGSLVDDDDGHWIHTGIDLDELGNVSGDAKLYIYGNTKVFGNIYGGGNMGKVTGNTIVIVNRDDE